MKKERKNHFIKDKDQIVLSIIVLVGLFGILIWHFLAPNTDIKTIYKVMIGIVGSTIIMAYDWKFPKSTSYLAAIFITAAGFYLLQKNFRHPSSEFVIGKKIFLINVCILLAIALILYLLIGNMRISMSILTIFIALVGLINYFVIDFRAIPVQPTDLFSFSTALSVSDNYDIFLNKDRCSLLLKALLLMALCTKLDGKIKKIIPRISGIVGIIILFYLCSPILQNEELQKNLGMRLMAFHPEYKCAQNGYPLYFLNELHYIRVQAPDCYDSEEYKNVQNTYIDKASDNQTAATPPNIVVIMNESFSDLGVLGELKTTEDYMPFTHSVLEGKVENSVYGTCYPSIVSGNTANSEYEFLTGNSLCALPENSIPYQLYLHHDIPSMATALKQYNDYNTFAAHCYDSGNWNRKNVYSYMQFDETCFIEDLEAQGYVNTEDPSTLIRKFVSDQTVLEQIIDRYEKKDEKPDFTFYVTMQNHGGYDKKFDNFTPDIKALNYRENASNKKKFCTETYLSLIRRSDQMLEDMVEYFKNYEEPTILLMFGDHQPSMSPIKSFASEDNSTVENSTKRYMVPFVMWANFEIEDEYIEKISLNYLQTILLEKAGLPLTPYQEYLSDLRKTLPVITQNVIIDNQGNYYSLLNHEETPYDDTLNMYKAFQYNYMFGKRKINQEFF